MDAPIVDRPWWIFELPLEPRTRGSNASPRARRGTDSGRVADSWRLLEAEIVSEALNDLIVGSRGASATSPLSTMEATIHFDEGSSILDRRARAILRDKMAVLRAHPAIPIVIGGFTGQQGTVARGMGLGLERVQAIRAYLLSRGIDSSRIRVAIRGAGWSLLERVAGTDDSGSLRGECRLRITDPEWALARN